MRSFLYSAFALALLTVPVLADGDEWSDSLRLQAQGSVKCDVTAIIGQQESELAGRKILEVKIQCSDGRRYDAVREEPSPDFRFHMCDTQVC